MRRIKLSAEEQAIENSLEKYVPVTGKELNEIVAAIEARKKNAVLNIRISHTDLNMIKRKAKKLGVKYQTLVSEVLHRIAQT